MERLRGANLGREGTVYEGLFLGATKGVRKARRMGGEGYRRKGSWREGTRPPK